MTAPFETWTVLPHGKLSAVEDNILTVVGNIHMPIGEFPRRMTVVRLKNRRLVIFSAIALDDDEMQALEAFGTPAFMIVPSDRHRLDAKIWKERYPAIRVITPAGGREKVAETVPVDATKVDFGDPDVVFVTVAGTHEHEAALEITTPNGVTLVVNEIIGAIHGEHGFKGWLLRLMGFAGDEPHVPAPVKLTFSEGKQALAAQFWRWANIPSLRRIIVSHGDIIADDPKAVLERLAEDLA